MVIRKVVAVGVLAASVVGAKLPAQDHTRYQVLFNRFQVPVMTLHNRRRRRKTRASADATPDPRLFAVIFLADGQWLVFTSERDGQAEIYRVPPRMAAASND